MILSHPCLCLQRLNFINTNCINSGYGNVITVLPNRPLVNKKNGMPENCHVAKPVSYTGSEGNTYSSFKPEEGLMISRH